MIPFTSAGGRGRNTYGLTRLFDANHTIEAVRKPDSVDASVLHYFAPPEDGILLAQRAKETVYSLVPTGRVVKRRRGNAAPGRRVDKPLRATMHLCFGEARQNELLRNPNGTKTKTAEVCRPGRFPGKRQPIIIGHYVRIGRAPRLWHHPDRTRLQMNKSQRAS